MVQVGISLNWNKEGMTDDESDDNESGDLTVAGWCKCGKERELRMRLTE